jgi:hypothetical protein
LETISIAWDREAYELPRGQKRPGESFRQVVKRLAGSRRPLASFVGADVVLAMGRADPTATGFGPG